MYSHEIKKLLEERNYLVNVKEYMQIMNSPQIDHIQYKNEQFYIWTNDRYEFVFKIKI